MNGEPVKLSSKQLRENVLKRKITDLFTPERSYQIDKTVDEAMQKFDAEKRKKALRTVEDLRRIYITR